MMKPATNIQNIKQMVKEFSYKHIIIKVNLGRNKFFSYSGVINGIYPSLFTIQPDDLSFQGKISYSYSDILCGNVKIIKK